MRNLIAAKLIIFVGVLAASVQCNASDLEATYLRRLEKIHAISGNGDEKLLSLIRKASIELEKDWSPQLAGEVARVFNELLNVNQNYFLVELIDPAMKKRPGQFGPVLEKALSARNRKLYRELVEMDENEEREGNG